MFISSALRTRSIFSDETTSLIADAVLAISNAEKAMVKEITAELAKTEPSTASPEDFPGSDY